MNEHIVTMWEPFTENELEGYINRYLDISGQIKQLEAERKEIQKKFEEYFKARKINEYRFYNYRLYKQERKSISYSDSGELKAYLESKGLWHLCVSPDKAKIDKLIKAKLLDPEKMQAFQQVKTTYAWVLEKVEEL